MTKPLLFFIWLVFACGCGSMPSTPPTTVEEKDMPQRDNPTATFPPAPAASPTILNEPIYEKSRWIGRGVNLGNALEAPREGDWGVTLKEEYFALIKKAGFNSVRIPIRWNAHAREQPPYTISQDFFDRIDWAVNQAISRDLTVILNIHHYAEMFIDPAGQKERFLAIWKQLAEHYQGYSEHLFFEPLNEPNGNLGLGTWNRLAAETIKEIRKSNPTRPIIIGPGDWNSLYQLDYLKLPEDDRNLIVTFHYYLPFHFTHQGADWVSGADAWLGTQWKGEEVELKSLRIDFLSAALWGKIHNRPLYLGEFGSYSKADIDSRARWTSTLARTAEENGIGWTYWEFCAGFGVYDPVLKEWNYPILNALLPGN